MEQDMGELVEVLESRDQALIATAQALLDGAKIEYAMNNELTGVLVGGIERGIQIWVKPEDADMARLVLSGLVQADEATEDQPDGSAVPSLEAPKPEQPFSIRLLIVAAVLLIPIILAIIYSLQKQPAR